MTISFFVSPNIAIVHSIRYKQFKMESVLVIYALILAGGKGTRLYPLSREKSPKQFLKVINEKSFLRNTVDRISPIVNKENIYVVTNKDYVDKIKGELPDINPNNVFVEPANKETAL